MKTMFTSLLCLAIISLAQCKKDTASLPPETQTGAGTFGCKINGKVWVPKGSDGYSGQNTFAFYQYIYPGPSGFVFSIRGTNYDGNPIEGVGIVVDSMKLHQGKLINLRSGLLGQSGKGSFIKIGYNIDVEYRTTEILTGEIVIKNLTKLI